MAKRDLPAVSFPATHGLAPTHNAAILPPALLGSFRTLFACAGVQEVELVMDKENATLNRGFAFVTFYNYACADEARRRFMETSDNT